MTPKIIVEPIIFDKTDNFDYKFFCFKGVAKFIQIDFNRFENHTRLYFDRDWNELDFSINTKKSSLQLFKPLNFEQMLEVAGKLSKDFEFIRVDLYTNGKQIFVGELTNWPESNILNFIPPKKEKEASQLLFKE